MQRPRRSRSTIPVFLPILLGVVVYAVGCGPSVPPQPPTVAITGPADGAVVTGSRTIVVQGSFADATAVEVAVDGSAPVSATLAGTTFTAAVTLGDRQNVIRATATGAGGSADDEVAVTYPFVRLGTNQAASLVIGASDFEEVPPFTASPSTLQAPYGRPFFDADRLFVGDFAGDQVLVFEPFPTADGATASWFVGSELGDGGAGTRAAGDVNGPQTVQAHDGRLYVLEFSNRRIQVFDPAPTGTGAVGSFVIGKADFDDASTVCERGLLDATEDFHIGGGRLVVADRNHNRVLVYQTVPTAAGALPDLVLGQSAFNSCDLNRGGAAAADTFDSPGGVWTDGERLVVADSGNNRVLVWSSFPTANGQAADLVLGQDDFTATDGAAGADGMSFPYFVDSNGNQLAVADGENSRVLVWDAFPDASGAPADVVLGQVDFDGYTEQPPAGQPTARNFDFPAGVAFADDFLVTVDANLPRLLVFRTAP